MDLRSQTFMTFSPTGKTGDIMKTMTLNCPDCRVFNVNLLPPQESLRRVFGPDEMLTVAFPVFGGRIPTALYNRLAYIKGNQSPAAIVVTYGNRHYDDAILEMGDFLEGHGFVPIAAAAFVAEHSIVPEIAAGRPDAADMKQVTKFALALKEKIDGLSCAEAGRVDLPGNHPYKKFDGLPFAPTSTKDCRVCGLCAAACPMKAVPKEHPERTDKSRCITCMACTAVCPYGCRRLRWINVFATKKLLKRACPVVRMPEYWL